MNNLGCGSPDAACMKFTCEASRQVSLVSHSMVKLTPTAQPK